LYFCITFQTAHFFLEKMATGLGPSQEQLLKEYADFAEHMCTQYADILGKYQSINEQSGRRSSMSSTMRGGAF
jgi:hypothetical protein